MELKIKLYEKEGKRCCYIEDGKENGQEYRDISLEWLGEMVTELFVCMEAMSKNKNICYERCSKSVYINRDM